VALTRSHGSAVRTRTANPRGRASHITNSVIVSRLRKLLSHPDVDEHHLFVRVAESAMDFGPFDVLGFHDYVPNEAPGVPPELDGLWLAARWGRPAYWHRPYGWGRADVLD